MFSKTLTEGFLECRVYEVSDPLLSYKIQTLLAEKMPALIPSDRR